MSAKVSAGVLLYRWRGDPAALQVFLVHPGGPFFAKKDLGAWTIPKGLPDDGDGEGAAGLERAALRELTEETGLVAEGPRLPLGTIVQKGGKTVHAWAVEGDTPPGWVLSSNTFELQWPPRSGRMQAFPEVDQGAFFGLEAARQKINPAQVPLIDRLVAQLARDDPE